MKRNTCFAWVLALLLALTPLCALSADAELAGAWDDAAGGKSTQEWLDGALSDQAGGASDSCVLCLLRSGADVVYSKYIASAAAKLEGGISNASTRQRTALALIACGAPERVPEDIVDGSAGKLGAMSWVWALHLLNNGAPSKQYTAESVADELLALQLDDGGWRVTGDAGDVDATCMVLQALSCCEPRSEALDAAIGRGLDFLSERQRDSGGFASMGTENAESAAQVLIALSGLNIAPDDPRFVKAGRTALDAMLDCQLPSGGFEHTPGSGESPIATAQALQALIALDMPGEPFYDFTGVQAAKDSEQGGASTEKSVAAPQEVHVSAEVNPGHSGGASSNSSESAGVQLPDSRDAVVLATSPASLLSKLPVWKLCAFSAIGALALAGVVFALTRKRAKGKHLLAVLLAAGIAAGAVWFVRIDSAADYYDPSALSSAHADGSVTLSIRCDAVAGRADNGSTPEDGTILPPAAIPFAEGDSVFDALTAAARANSIQLEYEGAEAMAYVTGINYLYEFDYGELSGWQYSVNGERMATSCGSCALHDGDEILWEYTTDLGGGLR